MYQLEEDYLPEVLNSGQIALITCGYRYLEAVYGLVGKTSTGAGALPRDERKCTAY
jgi:hypothetical protein